MPKRYLGHRPVWVWRASVSLLLCLMAVTVRPGMAADLAPLDVDLTIGIASAADDNGPPRLDQLFTVTLAVNNLGADTAEDVVVRVVVPIIPNATSIVLPQEQRTFGCRISEERGPIAVVTCYGGIVRGGERALIRFQMAIDDDPDEALLAALGDGDPALGSSITATATVDPDDTIPERDESNNNHAERITLAPGRTDR